MQSPRNKRCFNRHCWANADKQKLVNPDLTVLTVDSLTGNDAVMQAESHKSVGVDADVKGGSALSVTYVTQKPIFVYWNRTEI